MTAKRNKRRKVFLIILSVFLAVIVALVSTFFIVLKIGEIKLKKSLTPSDVLLEGEEYGDEADAYYNGVAYKYNKDVVNILIIGIDKEKIQKKSYIRFTDVACCIRIKGVLRNFGNKRLLFFNYFGNIRAECFESDNI